MVLSDHIQALRRGTTSERRAGTPVGSDRRLGIVRWAAIAPVDSLQQHASIGDRMPGSRQDKDQVPRIQALRRGLLALVLLLVGGGVVLVLRHPGTRVATLPPLPSPR